MIVWRVTVTPARAGSTHGRQRTATTSGHKAILDALELPEPPKYFDFTAAPS